MICELPSLNTLTSETLQIRMCYRVQQRSRVPSWLYLLALICRLYLVLHQPHRLHRLLLKSLRLILRSVSIKVCLPWTGGGRTIIATLALLGLHAMFWPFLVCHTNAYHAVYTQDDLRILR